MNTHETFDLSIIIPAYNSAATIAEMFPALLRQAKDYRTQIVVVDDGSTDDTATIVEKYALISKMTKIDLVRQKNQGKSITRNKGIHHAHGKILLFMDSDIIPASQMIKKHMKFHRQYSEIYIGFQGRVIQANPNNCVNWRRNNSVRKSTGWVINWTNVVFANLSLKRQFLINQNSLFREGLKYLQDIDLSWRFWKNGLRVYYSFDAIGYHHHPRTLKEFLKRAEEEAKAMKFWIKVEPRIEQMLDKKPLRKKFYFISQNSSFKQRIKNFFRKNLIPDKTENFWITFCEIISKVYFPSAYKIVSQLFIRKFIKTYKRYN